MILEIGGTIRVFPVLGGIMAGVISDYSGGRATTCCAMLIIAAPMVSQTFFAQTLVNMRKSVLTMLQIDLIY